MRFNSIAVFISILICVWCPEKGFAQEKTFPFTWFDKDEREMSGILSTSLTPLPADRQYRLDLSVTWFDRSGNPITDNNRKPVFCLSKWDYELIPAGKIDCLTFANRQISSLVFPESDQLVFQARQGFEGPVTLTARFLYALSREKFEAGKSEKVDFRGAGEIRIDFSVRNLGNAITDKSQKRLETIHPGYNPAYLRSIARKFRQTNRKLDDLVKQKDTAGASGPGYLQELETLSLVIENDLQLINPDSLPADSLSYYRQAYERAGRRILDLKSDYVRQRLSSTDLTTDANRIEQSRKNDSIRSAIRSRTEPVFKSQLDSLDKLQSAEKLIAAAIHSRIDGKSTRKDGNPEHDSLISQQSGIRNALGNLNFLHDSLWSNYRIDIDGLLPVREVENLHATFVRDRNDLQAAIGQTDADLAVLTAESTTSPWYLSGWIIWVALLVVLVVVFFIALWSTVRSRKIVAEQLKSIRKKSPGGVNPARTAPAGNFPDELTDEYLNIDYLTAMPESAVGIVHIHQAAVKSIYHQIQTALLEKRGTEFGGFLFGNQYRLSARKPATSELFIEKVCESKYLRSGISNDSNARADLVDEMNGLLQQNRKWRLIGWYTAATDHSMEIPEGLMKIHRTFFREKWQVGMLINPFSEVLLGATFVRRNSGYLDPMPDPAAFLKWDELYRQALSPANAVRKDGAEPNDSPKEYTALTIKNSWVDSVVCKVHFEKQATVDLSASAAQMAVPKDSYQVVGYLYGRVNVRQLPDGKGDEYEVFVDRFIELSNESVPRELPGFALLGWWGQSQADILSYLHNAIHYHEQTYPENFQMACLTHPGTGELRIFTRKQSLEMNNSTIETEEYTLNSVLSV